MVFNKAFEDGENFVILRKVLSSVFEKEKTNLVFKEDNVNELIETISKNYSLKLENLGGKLEIGRAHV